MYIMYVVYRIVIIYIYIILRVDFNFQSTPILYCTYFMPEQNSRAEIEDTKFSLTCSLKFFQS